MRSATIITVPAVGRMTQIHDRMPLTLPPEHWDAWLSLTGGADSITGLLQPPAEEAVDRLEFRPVGPEVGNVRNDAAGLIDPVAPIVDLRRITVRTRTGDLVLLSVLVSALVSVLVSAESALSAQANSSTEALSVDSGRS